MKWSCEFEACEFNFGISEEDNDVDFNKASKHVLSHLYKKEENAVKCPNCDAVLKNYKGAYGHLNRHRRQAELKLLKQCLMPEATQIIPDEDVEMEDVEDDFQAKEEGNLSCNAQAEMVSPDSVHTLNAQLCQKQTLFALKLTAVHLLPQEAVSYTHLTLPTKRIV